MCCDHLDLFGLFCCGFFCNQINHKNLKLKCVFSTLQKNPAPNPSIRFTWTDSNSQPTQTNTDSNSTKTVDEDPSPQMENQNPNCKAITDPPYYTHVSETQICAKKACKGNKAVKMSLFQGFMI